MVIVTLIYSDSDSVHGTVAGEMKKAIKSYYPLRIKLIPSKVCIIFSTDKTKSFFRRQLFLRR